MIRWLKRLFRSRRHTPESRLVRAVYDAAVTTVDNARHWANADSLSANAANSPSVRQKLRDRARYETTNNSYARGIVRTLANDMVGTGPRLQLQIPGDGDSRSSAVEVAFAQWADAVHLADKLHSMRISRAVDGEVFALLTQNPKPETPVELDLRVYEAEQVATPAMLFERPGEVDGIEFDERGNATVYHLLRHHPGDLLPTAQMPFERVPASSMIHYHRAERPGQARGIPEIMPALPLFAQLRRYTLAVIAAAETAADFAAVVYSNAPPDDSTEAPDPWEVIELEKRGMTTLPFGYTMSQLRAEQPASTYKDFKAEILNEIARCLNMPFNIAAANSAGYNFSSGRLDHLIYFRAIHIDQRHAERVLLNRLLSKWLDEAALIPGLIPDGLPPISQWRHQWFWDGRQEIDQLKDANATAIRLQDHTTTLAEEYARKGLDWQEALRQRAKEIALMEELGMPLSQSPQDEPREENDVDDEEAASSPAGAAA